MPLLNPTPGELVDRMTILRLKQSHSEGEVRRCFEEEHSELDAYLEIFRGESLSRDQALSETEQSLFNVNAQLWGFEDEVRELDLVHHESRLAQLAKVIADANDLRSTLIEGLNKSFGLGRVEKIYGEKQIKEAVNESV